MNKKKFSFVIKELTEVYKTEGTYEKVTIVYDIYNMVINYVVLEDSEGNKLKKEVERKFSSRNFFNDEAKKWHVSKIFDELGIIKYELVSSKTKVRATSEEIVKKMEEKYIEGKKPDTEEVASDTTIEGGSESDLYKELVALQFRF